MANFGHFPEKGLEIPDFRDPGRGVLHQPLAPGPRGSPERVPEPPPGRGGILASRRPLLGPPGTPGPGTTPGYRGAPARGVDVKPLPRDRRDPGSGAPRGSPGSPPGDWGSPGWGSGIPDPGPPGDLVPRASGPGPGTPPGLPRPSREGGFTSTPRGGAPRSRPVRDFDATTRSLSRPQRPSSAVGVILCYGGL